ncbi:MAG: transposase [Phycisphaeraceae bacterium]
MPNPIVIAHHLIWTAYGWWLPNDPRGSMSHLIASDLIAELGDLHFGRKTLQPAGAIIREFYQRAASALKYDLLTFDTPAIRAIADAFAAVIQEQNYTCYACAIMPDHIHLIVRKHKHTAEEMIEHFQNASRSRLRTLGLRAEDHPVRGGPGWKVFLDHPEEVWRTIRYVEENPVKIHWARQVWDLVTPYDNWPLHAGHSPNSPYAQRLRAVGRYPHDRRH